MPFITVGAVDLHYRQSGNMDIPTVVLLHGGGSTSATWSDLTPRLTEAGFHVLAPDLRGHGGSGRTERYRLEDYRNDVIELLEKLGHRHYVLIGHSLGAHVATCIAQAKPDQVSTMVLEEPPAPTAEGVVVDRISLLRIAILKRLEPFGRQRKFERRALISAIEQLRLPHPEWCATLPVITAATLILAGGSRSHISQHRLRDMADALPHATVMTAERRPPHPQQGAGRLRTSRPFSPGDCLVIGRSTPPVLRAGRAWSRINRWRRTPRRQASRWNRR